jgi:uroporphyrinogen III methyltransferase/synthase
VKPVNGKVYLVGAGPGDPKLITLRGKELLACADTIIYDYLANPALLAFAQETAEKIYVGKKGGARSELHQDHINHLMIEAAQAGRAVVRLKGGDPFIFGRGGEETEALAAANVPFEIVPGVSAAMGVPAYAGIPLTHRNMASSIAIITGHEDPTKENQIHWNHLATGCDTLVFLMGMGNLAEIMTQLMAHGRSPETPVALIQWGTYPYQKTVIGTVATIFAKAQQEKIRPPVTMVVGEVIALRNKMNWFESRPLFGRRILVTRAREKAAEFADQLASYGADVVLFPTIKIIPPSDYADLDVAIRQIEQYDTLLFTSVNGVESFFHRLTFLGYDVRILKGISICAIGPKTRDAITRIGLLCDFIPSEFTAEGILEELDRRGIAEKKFLLPRAMQAREVLPETIIKKGGQIDVVAAYQAIPPEESEIKKTWCKGPIDMVTFASASTVRNFMKKVNPEVQEMLSKSAVACIGPITAKAAQECGLRVDVVPQEYTFQALTESIVHYYRKKN